VKTLRVGLSLSSCRPARDRRLRPPRRCDGDADAWFAVCCRWRWYRRGFASQGSLQLSSDGRYTLAVDAGSNQVSVLRINPGGSLKRVSRRPVSANGTNPVSIAVYGPLVLRRQCNRRAAPAERTRAGRGHAGPGLGSGALPLRTVPDTEQRPSLEDAIPHAGAGWTRSGSAGRASSTSRVPDSMLVGLK